VERELTLDALKTEIFGHWPDETWHEVLRLVAGRIAPKFLKDILLWLVEQQDLSGTCQNIFLAAQCVAEVEVRNRAKLDGAENTVLKNLKMIAEPSLDLFLRQSKQSGNGVFQKATEQQAIRLVSMIWQDDPETKTWLCYLAKSSDSPLASFIFMCILAAEWQDDADTLDTIRFSAKSSRHKSVQRVAIDMLVNIWSKDDETLMIIKDCVQFDEHDGVRLTAMLGQARGWKNDPDTMEILKERALSDEADEVRKSAVRELAQGWKDDPEIQAFLKGL
jgi:hypothetical protein